MILSAEDGKLFYELWMPLLQYRKGNYERMSEIEEILDNTGYSFDVGAWEDKVDETLGK